jgi:type 1 glutamine amidotransferase
MMGLAFALVFVVAMVGCRSSRAQQPEAAKIKTLLITGDDVMPAHNWKVTSVATKEVLAKSGKFDVTIVEGLDVVCKDVLSKKDALQQYDLVVFMLYNKKKIKPCDMSKANLIDFVKGGKGFVVCHLASASFPDWKEWNAMCGRYWKMRTSGHGPRKPFKASIADKDHCITKGIPASFEVDDELYAKLLGDVKIDVLVEAYSDWSKKTEPLMFTLPYGEGRVFHNAFGHDAKPINNPNVSKMMVRGCEWAATGKVTD